MILLILACTDAPAPADSKVDTGDAPVDSGDTGETAHTGETGHTGETAETGDTGETGETGSPDADSDGYTVDEGDCDDTSASVHPGASEVEDGVDQDCDGVTDEGTSGYDDDGDGYTENDGDCNDRAADVSPAAVEVCDGVDQDCDGAVDDEAVDWLGYYPDDDGDGYGADAEVIWSCTYIGGRITTGGDCDDTDRSIHPGVRETCAGVDRDCDGLLGDDDPDVDLSTGSTFYEDDDGDGFGDPAASLRACALPAGASAEATDCDDTNAAIHPGATETCDEVDEDCDGHGDNGAPGAVSVWPDTDGDGFGGDAGYYATCAPPADALYTGGDCDDADAAVNPDASELCGDAIDNNCDGVEPTDCVPSGVLAFDDLYWSTGAAEAEFTVGESLAVGDFDVDGFDDLAVARPNEATLSGGAGAVAIWFGPLAPGQPALDAADLHLLGEADGDGVGSALAAIDPDGDGVDELLVGSEGRSRVYLVDVPRGVTTAPLADATTTIDGEAGEGLGARLEVGDLDGDGVEDVLIGVPDALTWSRGEVWLLSGASLTGSLRRADAATIWIGPVGEEALGEEMELAGDLDGDGRSELIFTSCSGESSWRECEYAIVSGAPEPGETFVRWPARTVIGTGIEAWEAGQHVASVGDLDGDGFGDLVFSDEGSYNWTGRFWVLYGPPPLGSFDLDDVADAFDGIGEDDNLGTTVAGVGDLDGDGRADFAISTRYYDDTDSGGLAIWYGPGPTTPGAVVPDALAEADADFEGTAIVHGDLDGDGFEDVVAAGHEYWGQSRVILVRGGAPRTDDTIEPVILTGAEDADGDGVSALDGDCDETDPGAHPGATETCGDGHDQDCDGRDLRCAPVGVDIDAIVWEPDGYSHSEVFSAAAATDIDGDGQADLVVGDEGQVVEIDGHSVYGGGVDVIWGPLGDEPGNLDAPDATLVGDEDFCNAGEDLSVADLDGDGVVDLFIGASRTSPLLDYTGTVFVRLSAGRWAGAESLADADIRIDGAVEDAGFGRWVAAGDLDDDGYPDLIAVTDQQYGYKDLTNVVYVFSGAGLASGTSDAASGVLLANDADNDPAFPVLLDLDQDGHEDLVLSDPEADDGSGGTGAVYVFRDPLTAASRTMADADAVLTASVEGAGDGLLVSDADADGREDLLIGSDGGVAWLLFGGTPLATGPLDAAAGATLAPGGTCGARPSAADLDADGAPDLMVFCGAGGTGWYGPTAPGATRTTGDFTRTLGGVPPSSGGASSPGDLDGDGFDEMLVTEDGTYGGHVQIGWGGQR